MINILKKLLDFIYYKNCYFCHKSDENSVFCSDCYNSIKFLPYKPIFTIGHIKVFSVTYYKNITQKLIRAVKFHNKKQLTFFQAKLMYEYWQKLNINEKNYTVIPVPTYSIKLRKRKFNHMNLICKHFCDLTNFSLDTTSLIRNRYTKPLYSLSKSEREKNLKGAFTLLNKNLNSPILLIDDISTTGTTLKEIISTLKQNGINNITCFVTAIAKTN